MKKQILLAIVAVASLAAGCKKESNETNKEASIDTKIIGRWQVNSGKYEYYDSKDIKIHEATSGNVGSMFEFRNDKTASLSTGTTALTGTYNISNKDNKNYVNVAMQGISATYEIAAISDSSMTLKNETKPASYYSGPELVTAARSEQTISLAKKP